MSTLPNLVDEMHRLISEAQQEGIFLRVLGGLAIKTHSPQASHRALVRSYPDIDFVTDKAGARRLEAFLTPRGYAPNKTFNTLSGDRRQLYYDLERNRQIDVFVGEFSMCHKLPLADRLALEPVTIPLAELFLTKAQIIELNRKDALDLLTLLLDHDVGPSDEETINCDLIADLCAKDWGLYTTVTMNIGKLSKLLASGEIGLDEARKVTIQGRLTALGRAIEAAPKSMGWKMRAKVGKRVRWYDEVEEVQR
jgi:hypothetical protein